MSPTWWDIFTSTTLGENVSNSNPERSAPIGHGGENVYDMKHSFRLKSGKPKSCFNAIFLAMCLVKYH